MPGRKAEREAGRRYLKKAEEFLRSAHEATQRSDWNAAGSAAIHAGINAADAYLAWPRRVRGIGKDHREIVRLLAERGRKDVAGNPRWEDAFRSHLRLAERGDLAPDVVAIGPFWTAADDPSEIDALVLAGRRREAVVAGEAKWARSVEATTIVRDPQRKDLGRSQRPFRRALRRMRRSR